MGSTATRFCIDLISPLFHSPELIVSQQNRKPNFRQISGSISFGILSKNGIFNTTVTLSIEKRPSFTCRPHKVAPNSTSVASNVEDDVESLLSEGANANLESIRSGKQSLSISSGARLENVRKSYKGVLLLKNVSWEVKKNEKVGLVGFNGAGKTTQLRILAGEEQADSGTVVKAKKNLKIVFMNQEFNLCNSSTVREELMKAFKEQLEVSERLKKVEKAIEMSVNDLDLMGRILDEFDLLHKRAQALELDKVEFKVNKLIPEIGFSLEDSERSVGSFSSGWQMRISLGKILLQDPDLLLLDEPTNHLDLDTVEWLEAYLKKQSVPMVIVSHDRAFLDQLCTKIVDTDMGVSSTYSGNYSKYIILKAMRVEALYKTWKKQQKEVTHMKDLIHRLSAGPNSGRASSAGKKLEKLQTEDHVEKPFVRKQVRIRFPELGRSGTSVLKIKNLSFGYNNKILFNKANLNVERGEKIAIIGPNGCGKSTILRIIMGLEKPEVGEVVFGNHNIHPNYFEQNQAEALDLGQTVLETVAEATDSKSLDDIKGLLGRCNFKADSLNKKVSFLSGGEKARLAFCKFMVKPSTLLVLDEPTNHLDIPSKEMLEEAILDYGGTIVTVSHDRHFIKKIANRVLEINDSKLRDYSGGYSNYLEENLDVKARESRRVAQLEEKAPMVKSKSKMTKAEKEARKKLKVEAYRKGRAKGRKLKMLKDQKNSSRYY